MFAALCTAVLLVFGVEANDARTAVTNDSAAADLAEVDVFEVSGLIDRVVAKGIERAIERSSNNGAQALILQVNSRGAVIDEARMTELLLAIRDSSLPIAMWVGPSGARAHGWAAQMLAVVDVSAMAPNSTIRSEEHTSELQSH